MVTEDSFSPLCMAIVNLSNCATTKLCATAVLTIRWTKPVYIFEESMNALVALEASNDFIPNFSIPGMPTEASFLLVNGVMYGKAESGGTYVHPMVCGHGWSCTCCT